MCLKKRKQERNRKLGGVGSGIRTLDYDAVSTELKINSTRCSLSLCSIIIIIKTWLWISTYLYSNDKGTDEGDKVNKQVPLCKTDHIPVKNHTNYGICTVLNSVNQTIL